MTRLDGVPDGYTLAAKGRGWEVYRNALVVVVLGDPNGMGEAHNCDAAGCGQDHVLRREPIGMLAEVLRDMGAA